MSGNEVNSKLSLDQIFRIIDRNSSGKIDEGDNTTLANIFGLQSGDTQIDESKCQNVENKVSIFTSALKKGGQLSSKDIFALVDENNNGVYDEGDNVELANMFGLKKNDKKIKEDSNTQKKTEILRNAIVDGNTLVVDDNQNLVLQRGKGNKAIIGPSFSPEEQVALMKKGIEPAQFLEAGFTEMTQTTQPDGTSKIVLFSKKDGFQIEITDNQSNPVSISRDSNNTLVVNGLKGKLVIPPSENLAQGPEVILQNVFEDNVEESSFVIDNQSGKPLTKTYVPENGALSYDAATVLNSNGFPAVEAADGGFNRLVVVEDSNGNIISSSLTSDVHDFSMKMGSSMIQPEGMTMRYNKNSNELFVEQLSNADIVIDGNNSSKGKDKLTICHVNNVRAMKGKTHTKPLEVTRALIEDEKGNLVKDDSFELITHSNGIDKYTEQFVKHNSIDIHTGGWLLRGTQRHSCQCGSRHSWGSQTGNILGGLNFSIDLPDSIVEKSVVLRPGDFQIYTREQKKKGLTADEKARELRAGNSNVGEITMKEYVLEIAELSASENDKAAYKRVPGAQKITDTGVTWNGASMSVVGDNATSRIQVTGDSLPIEVNGKTQTLTFTDNTCQLAPDAKGNMSAEAKAVLRDLYNLDPSMLSKAGFNHVELVKDSDGNMKELVLVNKDGTRLTMPSDEAYMFSAKTDIRKGLDGVYHIDGVVGRLEGSGMKIDCTNSNCYLSIVDNDPQSGSLTYSRVGDDGNYLGMYLSYQVPSGQEARVYNMGNDGKRPVKMREKDKVYSTFVVGTQIKPAEGTLGYQVVMPSKKI